MDRGKFWITLVSIIFFGLIVVSGILGFAWTHSPTVWTIEIGFDDESLDMMNSSLELAESLEDAEIPAEYYSHDFDEILRAR